MATTFHAFRRTVTTSGTPVQLDTFSVEPDQTIIIKAKDTNTGVISLGNTSAEAIKTNAENLLLNPGESVALKVSNTNTVWIDSTISGDIVEVLVGGEGIWGWVSLRTRLDSSNDSVTVQPGNTPNTTPWLVSEQAKTSGGATPYKLVSAATTNATSVKASAGQVYMITVSNVNADERYLKLYNKASAPTVGTDVPVHTFLIPGNTAGAGSNIPVPDCGLEFTTGIAFALTVEATDAGTTAVAANEIVVNLAFK